MAGVRLERIGTIFSRLEGLIKTGILKTEDIPIWYKIYEKFPPKIEPRYDRAIPNLPIKNIFYKEDEIRAKFHKDNKNLGLINLNSTSLTKTQTFLKIYNDLKNKESIQEPELYDKAFDIYKSTYSMRSTKEAEDGESISSLFKEAKEIKEKQKTKLIQDNQINVKKIFTE